MKGCRESDGDGRGRGERRRGGGRQTVGPRLPDGEVDDDDDEEENEGQEEMEIEEEVAVVQEREGRVMSRKGAVRGERKRRPCTRKSKKEVVSFFYQPYYNWLHDNDWVHN